MSNPFGGFNTTSPLSSLPHNPIHDLASNCIRNYLGPTVQSVADCILIRSFGRQRNNSCQPDHHFPTLSQITSKIRTHCGRDVNSERRLLVDSLTPLSEGRERVKLNTARGGEEDGFVVNRDAIRAALIVLLQHSLVRAIPPKDYDNNYPKGQGGRKTKNNTGMVRFRYSFDVDRAILLPRGPRFVEHARTKFGEEGSAIVEELLIRGRMLTLELVSAAFDCVRRSIAYNENNNNEEEIMTKEEKMVLYKKIIDGLKELVEKGFVEIFSPIGPATPVPVNHILKNNKEEKEFEFQDDEMAALGQKRKYPFDPIVKKDFDDSSSSNRTPMNLRSLPSYKENKDNNFDTIDLFVLSTLNSNRYKRVFSPGSVWRVNVHMFHASLRAFYLGRLVFERYGHRVEYAGAIVAAALKYIAHVEYAPGFQQFDPSMSQDQKRRLIEERSSFTAEDIMEFLPPTVLASLKNKAGGAISNLSSAIVALSKFNYPQVATEVGNAGSATGHVNSGSRSGGSGGGGVKFEICTSQLGAHLKNRIVHQVVVDHHGDVAARVCSILDAKGYLEGDVVAESAMVPAKEVREILHRLYKTNYISLLNLQQSKQHNASSAIYLWHVDPKRIRHTVENNICRAYCNLRLRRQHEMQLGKDWIERAKEAGTTDENDSELDALNYGKFCQGLERLDNACLQLDETLMTLKDFKF